ncbi:helix-turn-helix domain-containing protein [Sodalis ligni]|uniref:PucR family transcriptional regulator n=1 Tax=Sodalis ligni TaxID=2697027 RepID=UPI001BDE61BD|nr:helix-turn-helix domain-containing protein [Sodalis ligni]QWA09288.1 helix-turn-helix domain-containing protein [Sodalis ligni]
MLYVPTLSPSLRENTLSLADNLTVMTDGVFSSLPKMKEYADLTPVVRLDVNESITFSARLWFGSILNGTPPSQEDLQLFQEFGKRRVHQGTPLPALLRAFRLGALELWRGYILIAERNESLRGELLFNISPYLLEYFDEMAQLISQAYLKEQFRQARWRESLQHQLYGIIFTFPEETGEFHKTAAALGLDPSAPRIAFAVELPEADSNSPQFAQELDSVVSGIARRLTVAEDFLLRVWHHGRLVIWVPAVPGNAMNANDRMMAGRVAELREALPSSAMMGVGLMGQGARGWASTADEAIRALDFGMRCDDGRRVYFYSDIVMEESVRGTDTTLRYLVSLIEQLSGDPDLLLTLETYFEQCQRRKAAASVLGIHPNTLNYRLERIEKLLGARLDDVGWTTKLYVALKLRRAGPRIALNPDA